MADQNMLPGIGFVNETDTKQNLLPGSGFVNETEVVAGGADVLGVIGAGTGYIMCANEG